MKLLLTTAVFLLGTAFGAYYMPLTYFKMSCDTDKYGPHWVSADGLKNNSFRCKDTNILLAVEEDGEMIISLVKADLSYYYYKITGNRIN